MLPIEKNNLTQLIKKEKKLILTGLIAGLSLFIFYYIFFYVALYTSNSKIYVKNIVKSDFVANLDGGNSVASESGYSNPLFNLYEVLKSENIAYKVYPIIKEKFPEDLAVLGADSKEAFFESYVKLIKATTEPSTDIIKIKFMWPDQKHAPVVLNEILKVFKQENLIINKSGEAQRREVIDKQTLEIVKQLEDVRNKIKNHKLKNNTADLETETTNTIKIRMDLEEQANLLSSQIQYNKRKLNEFASELKLKNAEVALRATGIGNDPYLVKLSQDLAIAKQNHAKLRARFKDKYVDVISVNNEIDQLQTLINHRKQETAVNVVIPRAIYDGPSSEVVTNFALTQAEMVSLKSQWKELRKGIYSLKKRERSLPKAQMGLDELKKLEDALAGAYKNIKEKQLEAGIRESEIIDNIIILSHPSKATSLIIFIITRFFGFILLGVLLGLAIAYIKQALEDKWVDMAEIETYTGQNVLGSIPWVKNLDDETTENIMDAAYTNLAAKILTKMHLNKSSVITFISTNKSQPKSTITETLTRKFSEMNKSVLLMDLVLKETKEFDLLEAVKLINKELRNNNEQNTENIHNILKGAIRKQSYNYETKTLKLDKIETSNKCENLNAVITSKGFKYILSSLKNHYEFIFINAPHGFISLPEIQNLKKLSENVTILSSLKTNRQELIKFVKNISDSDTKILGIIPREENAELEKHINTLEEFRLLELYKISDNILEEDEDTISVK